MVTHFDNFVTKLLVPLASQHLLLQDMMTKVTQLQAEQHPCLSSYLQGCHQQVGCHS